MSPQHMPQRSCHSVLVIWRVVSFILLCLCGFLLGGTGGFLVLLLFEPSEISTFFPPTLPKVVFLGLGSLIGAGLGIWAGVHTEIEWRKDDG